MTTRRKGVYSHLELLDARDWGLIVYDEVHLLPAPIFRMTADLQARRRLGLTATLVREDGREGDVFSLIGPKRYDAPWKDIESQGWIAPADCVEVRVTLPSAERMAYAVAEPEERYRLASCTHHKIDVVRRLVDQHPGQPTLVIGQYLDQLDEIATALDAPTITGATPVKERQRLFEAFRRRRGRAAGGLEGRELLHRPAHRRGRDPGLGVVRLAPGGGPAARPPAPPEVRGQDRALLHDRQPRHRRRGLRRQPAAVPGRAGLRLLHPRRRGLTRSYVDAQERSATRSASGGPESLSDPVARGELGEIRRLETDYGTWAVKQALEPFDAEDMAAARDQRRRSTAPAGRPASRRRSRDPRPDGRVHRRGLRRARARYSWVDLDEPDTGLDPAAVGALVARLHAVAAPARGRVHEWFEAPIGRVSGRGCSRRLARPGRRTPTGSRS